MGQVRTRLGLDTRVFSPQSLDAFIGYLDDVERQAEPTHVKTALAVYGDPEPFTSLFEE